MGRKFLRVVGNNLQLFVLATCSGSLAPLTDQASDGDTAKTVRDAGPHPYLGWQGPAGGVVVVEGWLTFKWESCQQMSKYHHSKQ